MDEFRRDGQVGRSALRAGMDRKTARKYLALEKPPSELVEPRTSRTLKGPDLAPVAG